MEDLIHGYGFCRTDIHTGTTVYTQLIVYNCLVILHRDCHCRTFIHTAFATGTCIFVNYCRHVNLLLTVIKDVKKFSNIP